MDRASVAALAYVHVVATQWARCSHIHPSTHRDGRHRRLGLPPSPPGRSVRAGDEALRPRCSSAAPGFPLTWAEVKGKRQGHGRWSRGGTEAGQGGGEPAQCRWARAAGGRRQQMLAGGRLGVWHAPLHLPPTLRAAFRFGLSRPGGAHCVGGRLGVAHWGWLAGGRHPMARPALHRVGTKVCAEPRMESTLHSVGGLRRRLPTPVHWIGWSTSSGWAGPIAGCSGPSALRPRAAPSTHTSVHCDGRHREVVLKPRTPITPARCSARPGARPGAGFPLDLGRGQGETAGPRPVVKGWNGGRSRGWGNLREADGQGGERAEGL